VRVEGEEGHLVGSAIRSSGPICICGESARVGGAGGGGRRGMEVRRS
jgi:hypothetical protein